MINTCPTIVTIHFVCTGETIPFSICNAIRGSLPHDQSIETLTHCFTTGKGHVTCDLPSVSKEQLEMLQGLKDLVANVKSIVFCCTVCSHTEHIAGTGYLPVHQCSSERSCTRCGYIFTPSSDEATKCLPCTLLIGLEGHRTKQAVEASLRARNLQEK